MSEISKLDQNLIIKKIDNETHNLQITDNETLMSVVGQFDQNLKELSKLTNTNVFFRGNSITCKGSKENIDIFCKAIEYKWHKRISPSKPNYQINNTYRYSIYAGLYNFILKLFYVRVYPFKIMQKIKKYKR